MKRMFTQQSWVPPKVHQEIDNHTFSCQTQYRNQEKCGKLSLVYDPVEIECSPSNQPPPRTFLPPSLKIHQRSCTADSPMVKAPKEESYANKQKAMVNYPKLKSQKSRQDKGKVEEKGEEEEKFQLSRPKTYTVEPSVEDLALAITSARELEDAEARRELMAVIQVQRVAGQQLFLSCDAFSVLAQ